MYNSNVWHQGCDLVMHHKKTTSSAQQEVGSDNTKGAFRPEKSTSLLALVRTKYNVDFFFGLVLRFYTALFASEPEFVKKTKTKHVC